MRREKEMFELILKIAREDERIRAVYMNGSRTNPNAPKDIFQDYDIVYVVTETASFIKDRKWISIFGELLIIQEPDKNDQAVGMEMDFYLSYGYLMLFTDGNRIDLHIETKESMNGGTSVINSQFHCWIRTAVYHTYLLLQILTTM
jgi:aminoglycoside 6-adenylyltransferase